MPYWWVERQQELKALAKGKLPLFVYNEESLNDAFFDLLAVPFVERVFQPMEGTAHPEILRKAVELGIGFMCRSLSDVDRLFRLFPGLDPGCLLFVPFKEAREEYERALKFGMHVVAGTEAWMSWPDLFERCPFLRRVRVRSDGCALEESISALPFNAEGVYLEVEGSQIPPVDLRSLIPSLHEQAGFVADRHALCLGGGTGLPVHPEKDTIMTSILSDCLEDMVERYAGLRIWVEPGRHLVSHAGILLLSGEKDGNMDETLDGARVIANQGCGGGWGKVAAGSVAAHFLKARRICQVKI